MPTLDRRQFSPSAARNRDPILAVLQRVLPAAGLVLEIGSGTGEHAVHFARHLPALCWQPSDADPAALASITDWVAHSGLPNLLAPILVIATISFAHAIVAESTLSYLGVGLPPTQPSLGTLIRIGQGFLFSGEWWILLFPSLVLLALALSVNLVGDWLRDALNPKLQ